MKKQQQENNDNDDVFSRVSIRPFRVTDADDLYTYINDPKVGRYTALPWNMDGKTYSKSEVSSYIENFCIPHPYCRSVCIDDRTVGVGLVIPAGDGGSWRRGVAGLAVSPAYWSKGVGRRAVELLVVDVFIAIPELVRFEAVCDVENVGIHKVMEGVGLRREGVLRKYMFLRGEYRDVVMYSMLVDDEKRLALLKPKLNSRL